MATENPRLSFRQLINLNAGWLGLSFMWNALHPIVLPALLLNFVPDERKNTYLGLLTFAGLLLALVIQPLSGAASDGWKSRFGRRRPLIAIGTALDLAFLAVLARAPNLNWLIVGYIGLQVSSNLAQGPLQGLLRDQVPATQLGTASSAKVFLDVLSLVLASLLAARYMGPQAGGVTIVMLVILVALAITTSLTILGVREQPTAALRSDTESSERLSLPGGLGGQSDYAWLIAQRILFLLGVYGLQAFAQYYLQDVLRVPDPAQQTGQLLAGISTGVLVLVLAGGWLTDRFGATRVLYAAAAITALGLLLFSLASSPSALPVSGAALGAGIGLFLTSNWALANRLAPAGQAGKYLGLTNIATAGAAALVRLQGPFIDLLNQAHPAEWMGYRSLFALSGLCVLLSAAVLTRIRVRV